MNTLLKISLKSMAIVPILITGLQAMGDPENDPGNKPSKLVKLRPLGIDPVIKFSFDDCPFELQIKIFKPMVIQYSLEGKPIPLPIVCRDWQETFAVIFPDEESKNRTLIPIWTWHSVFKTAQHISKVAQLLENPNNTLRPEYLWENICFMQTQIQSWCAVREKTNHFAKPGEEEGPRAPGYEVNLSVLQGQVNEIIAFNNDLYQSSQIEPSERPFTAEDLAEGYRQLNIDVCNVFHPNGIPGRDGNPLITRLKTLFYAMDDLIMERHGNAYTLWPQLCEFMPGMI